MERRVTAAPAAIPAIAKRCGKEGKRSPGEDLIGVRAGRADVKRQDR
jgi:hypothetical protein